MPGTPAPTLDRLGAARNVVDDDTAIAAALADQKRWIRPLYRMAYYALAGDIILTGQLPGPGPALVLNSWLPWWGLNLVVCVSIAQLADDGTVNRTSLHLPRRQIVAVCGHVCP